jgi:hypothetical protein
VASYCDRSNSDNEQQCTHLLPCVALIRSAESEFEYGRKSDVAGTPRYSNTHHINHYTLLVLLAIAHYQETAYKSE